MLQSIAASACVNVVFASMCISAFASTALYRLIRTRRSDKPNDDELRRIVCLAAEEDIAGLEFRDHCRAQSMRAAQPATQITYITPAWLWYYIYTVGLGVFGMVTQSLAVGLIYNSTNALAMTGLYAPRRPCHVQQRHGHQPHHVRGADVRLRGRAPRRRLRGTAAWLHPALFSWS